MKAARQVPTRVVGRKIAQRLVREWETMQSLYIPSRETRFTCMLDLLERRLPARFQALDLGCGPGSLSERLLNRFPHAQCTALDFDPLLLELGRTCLGDMGGRLRWVEADLRQADWAGSLGRGRFDAVLSTTALHWLSPEELKNVYAEAWKRMRKGGILLNGDRATIGPAERELRRLTTDAHMRTLKKRVGKSPEHPWRNWWGEVRSRQELLPLLEERHRRFRNEEHWDPDLPATTHLRYLRGVGFSEASVVWRELINAVMVGLKN